MVLLKSPFRIDCARFRAVLHFVRYLTLLLEVQKRKNTCLLTKYKLFDMYICVSVSNPPDSTIPCGVIQSFYHPQLIHTCVISIYLRRQSDHSGSSNKTALYVNKPPRRHGLISFRNDTRGVFWV